VLFSEPKIPQSRSSSVRAVGYTGFSALQRAENSSIFGCTDKCCRSIRVSVLFSEPKIPQYRPAMCEATLLPVSVLFSEPKIPQYDDLDWVARRIHVSVLFSEPKIHQSPGDCRIADDSTMFQCSSASRKFLNARWEVSGDVAA